MTIVNPALTQFNTGEITPFLGGRTDYKKYTSSAEYMENCLPLVYGPFIKRSGTRFVNSIKIKGSKTLLKPFVFSKSQAYCLEVGVGYIRFHTNNGTVVDDSNNIIEIATQFNADDLDNLDFTQSNDFIYIASGRIPVQLLKRFSHTSWTIENTQWTDGPYQDENLIKDHTVASSATAIGSTTLTSNFDLFTSDMIGMPIRLRKVAVGTSTSNAVGWATITAVANARSATALIQEQLFDTSATYAWRIGEFSALRGYPKKLTLHKGRLWLASTEAKPNSLWSSRPDSYHDFGPTEWLNNEVVDDCSIVLTMTTTETNRIQWMKAMKQLFVGTLGAEFKIDASDQFLTPSNCTSEEVSQYGSANIAPFKYANELVYIQQSGRKIRTMFYDLGSDAFNSTDLSLFGEHLTYSGIAGLTRQVEPYSALWAWLNDGKLRSVTYEKTQEVVAWSRQNLGGRRVRVLSGCTIPFIEENRDQTWLLVERWINNEFVQYIETVDRIFDSQVSQVQGYFVDCGGTYDNPLAITDIYSEEDTTVIVIPSHGLSNGAKIRITEIENYSEEAAIESNIKGFESLNNTNHIVTVIDADTLSIPKDSSDFVDYISWQAGVCRAFVSAITQGISHLEGEMVWAVVDGAVSQRRKVVNGAITLDSPGTIVHVGLAYICKYRSVRLDIAMGQNNALAAKQKIHNLYIQVYRTSHFKYGESSGSESQPARKYGIDRMDTAPSLKTELIQIPFDASWGSEPHITIVSDLPLPLCVLGITTKASVN